MKLWRPLTEVPAGLDFYKRNFSSYKMEITSASLGLSAGRFSWIFSSERFWPKYLKELSKLKSEVKRNLDKVEGIPAPHVKAYRFNPALFSEDEGKYEAQELDLSKAYLTAAQILGLIGPATVQRLSKIRKVWRLRLLGALARKKTIQYFEDGGIVKTEKLEDKELSHAWNCICQLVDLVQNQMAESLGPDFLFYWYDNLFARRGAFRPAVLASCSEFKYRIEDKVVEYRSKPESLAMRISDGRVFWLPSVQSHSVGTLPILSVIRRKSLLTG